MAMAVKNRTVQRTSENAVKSNKKQKKVHAWNLEQPGEIDYTFLVIVILVVAAGLVMLLSASAPAGKTMNDNSY